MPRTLRTFLPLTGDPAALAGAFASNPAQWLPNAQRAGPDRWSMTVHAGTLTRTVTATIGSPWRAGSTCWRTVAWDPAAEPGEPVPLERMLPSLDGEVGLHVEPGGRITIVLDARYHPPGGALGTAVDAVGLRRIAQGTAERFLQDIAARLTAEALLVAEDQQPDTQEESPAPTGTRHTSDVP